MSTPSEAQVSQTDSSLQTIAQIIKRNRLEKGLTQEMLGKKIGATASYICQLERGAKKLSIKRSDKLAEVLELDVNEFKKKVLIDNGQLIPEEQVSSKLRNEVKNLIEKLQRLSSFL